MFSASVSRRAISDYIRTTLDVDANGRWVYRPLNDGDALVRSLQLEAKAPGKLLAEALSSLRPARQLQPQLVARVVRARPRQPPRRPDPDVGHRRHRLPQGRPEHGQQPVLAEGRLGADLGCQSQLQQTRRDLDAYLLYKFNPRYQLRVSANNLLRQDNPSDRIYQDAAGTSRETSFNAGYVRVGVNLEMKF
jgi:outer membrane receptor for ferrienterochelin and colicins